MTTCRLCGACGGGNITCPECRNNSELLSQEAKDKLRFVPVGYPVGTTTESPHVPLVKSVNRKFRKLRQRASRP